MKARVDSPIYQARRELKESLSTVAVQVCDEITVGVQKLICDIIGSKPLCPLSGKILRLKAIVLKHSWRYRKLSRLSNSTWEGHKSDGSALIQMKASKSMSEMEAAKMTVGWDGGQVDFIQLRLSVSIAVTAVPCSPISLLFYCHVIASHVNSGN
jgi:hypothetical protein